MHYRLLAYVFARQHFNSLGLVLNPALYATRSYHDFGKSDNARGELHVDCGVGGRWNLDRERIRYKTESPNDHNLRSGRKAERSISRRIGKGTGRSRANHRARNRLRSASNAHRQRARGKCVCRFLLSRT
jgi:hypothetical protein